MTDPRTNDGGEVATGRGPTSTASRQEPGDADVAVIGGGLAGMAAAILAARDGARVVLLDGQTPGGRARGSSYHGFWLNQGPHALYLQGAAMRVLREIGIEPRGFAPATSGSGGVRHGRVGKLPVDGLTLLTTKLLGLRGKEQTGRLLRTTARWRPADHAGESVADWLASLKVGDDVTELIAMLIRVATFTADHRQLSADAAIGQLQMALGEGVLYLDGSWQQLVDALIAAVADSGAEVRRAPAVSRLEPIGDRWSVATAGGSITATTVIVANGGPAAAAGVLPDDPDWGRLGPPAEVASWELAVRRAPSPNVMFGLDAPLYLSVHSQPVPADSALPRVVYVARYGVTTTAADRAELRSFAALAGIGDDDIVAERFQHRLVAVTSIPTPDRGGLAGRPAVVSARWPGVFLAGDWVGPEGMLSDAALASAAVAARSAVHHVRLSTPSATIAS